MNHTEFAVSRFENRNGVTSWRVSGLLAGVRIRKNFKTREEAAAEKATLEIKALQIASGQRAIVTTLTETQAREAEAVFHRLAGNARSLSFFVDFALANYREPSWVPAQGGVSASWRSNLPIICRAFPALAHF